MKKFKKPKLHPNRYKTKYTYLNAVAKMNEKLFEQAFGSDEQMSAAKRFKALVKEKMQRYNISLTKAIKAVQRRREFMSQGELMSSNFYAKLYENKEALKELRKLNHHKKVDEYQFVYKGTDGKVEFYQYGNIEITADISPDSDVSTFEFKGENNEKRTYTKRKKGNKRSKKSN